MASGEDVKDIFKGQILKEPKLLQLDSGFYKWFTAMHSEVAKYCRKKMKNGGVCIYIYLEEALKFTNVSLKKHCKDTILKLLLSNQDLTRKM
jgi:hypothetical protein